MGYLRILGVAVATVSAVAMQSLDLHHEGDYTIVVHDKFNDLWTSINLKVDGDIPKEFQIKNAVSSIPEKFKIADNLSKEVAHRERKYSWYWIDKLLPRGVLREKDAVGKIILVRNLQNDDDGAVFDTTINNHHYRFLDGRQLSVLIHKSGISTEDVLVTFKNLISFGFDDRWPPSVKDMKDLGTNKMCGKIELSRVEGMWFKHPVEWYRDGDTILFLFLKEVKEVPMKFPPEPATLFGGLPYGDKRPWRRFEGSNREELSKEQCDTFRKTQKIDRPDDSDSQTPNK